MEENREFDEGFADDRFQYQGMSFSEMEKKEADRASQSLYEIESKLYGESVSMQASTASTREAAYPKYYSEGYDANHEGVDQKEMSCWQKAFPYLRLTGTAVVRPSEEEAPVVPSPAIHGNNPHHVDDYRELLESSQTRLCVAGTAIRPMVLTSEKDQQAIEAAEGEVIEQDGVLEECFVSNQEGNEGSIDGDPNEVDPAVSQREEILQSLVAMCWDDVVDTLKPLVQRVVEVARANSIPYEIANPTIVTDETLVHDEMFQVDKVAVPGFSFASDSDESSGW